MFQETTTRQNNGGLNNLSALPFASFDAHSQNGTPKASLMVNRS